MIILVRSEFSCSYESNGSILGMKCEFNIQTSMEETGCYLQMTSIDLEIDSRILRKLLTQSPSLEKPI